MSQMDSATKGQISPKTKRFKNLIIAFGICLGLLTVSSISSSLSSAETSVAQGIRKLKDCKSEEQPVKIDEITATQNELKFKTHHNFIASYLLQESSFERKNKKSKEHGDFISNLKQIHRTIVIQTLGSF